MIFPKVNRPLLIQIGFWLLVTLLFLIDRKYLLWKLALPHVAACLFVRIGLLAALATLHTRLLWPRFAQTGRYLPYAATLILGVDAYILLQSAYDTYLFGFVVGDEERRGLWANLPYNLLATLWYLVVTLLLHLVLTRPANVQMRPEKSSPTPAPNECNGTETIWLKSGTQRVKVAVGDIRYVQGLKDYSLVFTPEGRVVAQGSLKVLAEQLPAGQFVRVHKSYLVPIGKLRCLGTDHVELGDARIPIGRSYRKALVSQLTDSSLPIS